MEWRSWNGKVIDSQTVSHQHLSNKIWFHRILNNREIKQLTLVLEERFEGVLLPYTPDGSFKQEIQDLEDLGMLREQIGTLNYDIILTDENGEQWIGEVMYA